MLFLILFLVFVGVVFILLGIRSMFFTKEIVLTSRLLDMLAFGFFLTALKAGSNKAYQYRLRGRKKEVFGAVILAVGIFLVFSGLLTFKYLQQIPYLNH